MLQRRSPTRSAACESTCARASYARTASRSKASTPPASTQAASPGAATRAAWPPHWSSASQPPKTCVSNQARRAWPGALSPRLAAYLIPARKRSAFARRKINAGALVVRERRGAELRDAEAAVLLLDLGAGLRRVAVLLAQLVAARLPDEEEVRHSRADATRSRRRPARRRPSWSPRRPARARSCRRASAHVPRAPRSSAAAARRARRRGSPSRSRRRRAG